MTEFRDELRASIFRVHWAHHWDLGPVRIAVSTQGRNTIPEEVKGRYQEEGAILLDLSGNFPRPTSVLTHDTDLEIDGLSFGCGTLYGIRIPWGEVLAIGFASGPLISFHRERVHKTPEPPPEPRPGVVSLAEFRRRRWGLN